jgi:serine/threonine protein kinase
MAALLEGETEMERASPCHTFVTVAARYGEGSVLAEKYRLDSVLGVGAMGAVWQATNLLLDARVAIKLAHAELAGGSFRARLQLEARAAAAFVHPGIVRVFDVGETDAGDPFIVMELLQGATLAQMTSQGRLSAQRAVQIVLPIVDALAAMHARGVVHRDMKPDNLLVALEDQRVQPKILDFGIAISNDPHGAPLAINDGGVLVGSLEYMSPEQAEASEDIDHRTDIWSICVVLYEAIAGEMPFDASEAMLLLRAIIMDDPLPLTDRGVADEQLWDIVRVGLKKDRESRHASMSALGKKLARWLLDRGVHEDICGTSLQSKWFASDEPILGGVNALPRAPYHAEAAESVRTTPPRARSSRGPARRGGRRARARLVRAIKTCTVLGAMGLVFFTTPPKNAVSALMASKAWLEHRAIEPIAWSPWPSREEARIEEASPERRIEVSTAKTEIDQSSRKLAADHAVTSAVQRRPSTPSSVPIRKAQAAANKVGLGLIAPY